MAGVGVCIPGRSWKFACYLSILAIPFKGPQIGMLLSLAYLAFCAISNMQSFYDRGAPVRPCDALEPPWARPVKYSSIRCARNLANPGCLRHRGKRACRNLRPQPERSGARVRPSTIESRAVLACGCHDLCCIRRHASVGAVASHGHSTGAPRGGSADGHGIGSSQGCRIHDGMDIEQ